MKPIFHSNNLSLFVFSTRYSCFLYIMALRWLRLKHKTKTWPFEKINKTIQSQGTNNQYQEWKEILLQILHTSEYFLRRYYKKLQVNNFENAVDELNIILGKWNLPMLIQEEIENLNKSITIRRIVSVLKTAPASSPQKNHQNSRPK